MAEELELVKISELPEASNVTATDVAPIVQNGVTKKAPLPVIRKYVVDSLGSAAKASTSDFEPSGSVLEVDLKTQERADEQNKRIDRIEVAAYLLRNNKIFKAYRTKALMLADVANIPANSLVHVVNDPANNAETNDINGQYHYDGNDFLKLPDGFLDLINEKSDQVLESSKSYTDGRITSLQQTAATDASTKATAAKDDAIHTAAIDAQIKADDAESAAITAAASDATAKAATAKSEAITAAATDASTKSQAAETNAKQAAENNDVKLLLALQQIIQTISDNRIELDQTDAALNAEDQLINTRVTRLLLAIQQLTQTISDNRSELDSLIATNATAISSNATLINTLQTSTALEDQSINTRIARLLLSIQQIIQIIAENRDELDVVISNNSSSIALINNESSLTNTRIARLLVSIQQIIQTMSDNRDEFDAVSSTLVLEDQLINTRITRLNSALQIITDSISQLLIDLTDALDYFSESKKLSRNLLQQEFAVEFLKLDGFDPKDAGSNKYVEAEKIIFFPTPDNVIRIDIETGQALPTAKGTVINTVTAINVDGQILKNFGTLEVQGSSSAAFPKKNWTICLFSDEARTTAIKIKLGHMIMQEELVFKANFVDNTHTRNLAVNRLYDEMQLSRTGFPKREVDFVNMLNPDLTIENYNGLTYMPSGATGHVDGFQTVIYINDEFYGIGSLNIGKKRDNYNLDKNNQKHIQLEPNGGVNLYAWPLNPLDQPSQTVITPAFEIRRPSSWKADAQASYERFRTFLSMSRTDMQTAGIDNYINRAQMQDYIILCQVCDLWDHLHKNTLYTTWDGLIWNFMPYDLDTVFGLHFLGNYFDENGNALHPATALRIPTTSANNNWGTLAKFRLIYGTDIDARYAALRKAKIIDVDHIVKLCEDILRKFPTALLEAENTRWNTGATSIYSSLLQTSSIHQINAWLTQRMPIIDAYFNYTNS